jgi:hypothetical protein
MMMRPFAWMMNLMLLYCAAGVAEQQESQRVYLYSFRGDIVCTSATGDRIALQRMTEIPVGSAVQMGAGAVMKVFGGKDVFGEFVGPKKYTFDELREGLHKVSGEHERKIGRFLEGLWNRLREGIAGFSSEIIDTSTPASVRGEVAGAGSVDLIPLAPHNLCVTEGTVIFTWFNGGYTQPQTVRIIDADYEPVYEAETTGTSLALDVNKVGLKPGVAYQWSVTVPQSSRYEIPFRIVGKQTMATIREDLLAAADMAGGDETGAILQRAMVYEDAKCFGNAYYEYASAFKRDTSETVRKLFELFLVQNLGLSRNDMELILPPAVPVREPVPPSEPSINK